MNKWKLIAETQDIIWIWIILDKNKLHDLTSIFYLRVLCATKISAPKEREMSFLRALSESWFEGAQKKKRKAVIYYFQIKINMHITFDPIHYQTVLETTLTLVWFGHCVVCSSSIYGFWLPLWYLQTLLVSIPFDRIVQLWHKIDKRRLYGVI